MMQMTDHATELSTGLRALCSLCEGFHGEQQVRAAAEPLTPDAMPKPFQRLLVHRDHMTTTLEAFYGRSVALGVLRHQHEGDDYAREIVLTLPDSKAIVEFGIVRINLRLITPSAREEILAGDAPLGDILIRHDIMRRIDPKWYFRIQPTSCLAQSFAPKPPSELFGRLGIIHCNEQPVIKLLEIVGDAR